MHYEFIHLGDATLCIAWGSNFKAFEHDGGESYSNVPIPSFPSVQPAWYFHPIDISLHLKFPVRWLSLTNTR